MDVVVTAPDGTDLGSTSRFELDLSFGSSGNNFEFSSGILGVGRGSYVTIEGTEYGGVVDSLRSDVVSGRSKKTWSGRTWQGILYGKLLYPDGGQDHLSVSGEANAVLAQLVERVGLTSVFAVSAEDSGISVSKTFERPAVDAYSGISSMLSEAGAVLVIRREDGVTRMWAEAARTFGDVDSDAMDFSMTRAWRPVNHLMCAGEGELSERIVLHLYADESGRVSKTQTLFGIDEVAELYDYSNADLERLEEDGTKRLSEYQTQGDIEVDVRSGADMRVGDVVIGVDRDDGSAVQAIVNKKILSVRGGVASVSYEAGDSNTGTKGGIFGTAEAPAPVSLSDVVGIMTLSEITGR